MGLTRSSVGHSLGAERASVGHADYTVALAGNPNVGKSTVFNALTGMHQHTGNWAGKTVGNAIGYTVCDGKEIALVDIPGTYSLMAHSREEEIARDFVCFGLPDAVVVVCDATCLERNLNLVLQVREAAARTVVCVNLLDEAKRKGITVDLRELSSRLGLPVVGVVARRKRTLSALGAALAKALDREVETKKKITYPSVVEDAVKIVESAITVLEIKGLDPRWLALRMIEEESSLTVRLREHLGEELWHDAALTAARERARELLRERGMTPAMLQDALVESMTGEAVEIASRAVCTSTDVGEGRDRRIDRILTGGPLAYPAMLLLLALVFWITIVGANYPSGWLSTGFSALGVQLERMLCFLRVSVSVREFLLDGVYRVLSTVVSVMLPPMAIFFPLFTLLEDVGYLPRIAYNLDRPFCRCQACGKQALTMCMGFGCNAAGVVGCRIIDSPRERLLAVLTNSLVPCNGRFPAMIMVLAVFFAGSVGGGILPSLMLTAVVLLGIAVTFLATGLLSRTLLKGTASSFTLELPPYRRPQIGRVLVRSVFDRTLFVLGRAAAVAAPLGGIIWLLSNITVGELSLAGHMAAFFDPFARLMGLDGVIFTGFLLGFPANEIVLPIVLMLYLATGVMPEIESVADIGRLLTANGWTAVTAVCFVLFSLMHWPCSTTVWTVKKETGSMFYTAVSVVLPTLLGILVCMAVRGAATLLGF
ncbi:MAG: ferrous iron transport protein B [Ruminococcaceae bacterium]|nr:ferrous iron transport protein B [Oscillospiraceae bacterium]